MSKKSYVEIDVDGEQQFLTPYMPFGVAVDLTIFTIRHEKLQVLLIERGQDPWKGSWALPGGFTNPDESTDDAAYRELLEETGIDLHAIPNGSYLEQLKTYSAPNRDPRQRVVSVAYFILLADLPEPVAGDDAAKAKWWAVDEILGENSAISLAADHYEIVSDAYQRVQNKLEYSTIALQFVKKEFTLRDLWEVYRIVWGQNSILFSNFRRKVLSVPGFVVPTEKSTEGLNGHPSKIYQKGTAGDIRPPLMR